MLDLLPFVRPAHAPSSCCKHKALHLLPMSRPKASQEQKRKTAQAAKHSLPQLKKRKHAMWPEVP
jgi:hypothetical protein